MDFAAKLNSLSACSPNWSASEAEYIPDEGSADFYPEESPVHDVTVAPFAIERHPVTNAQFAEFVGATDYVTVAEQSLDPAAFRAFRSARLSLRALWSFSTDASARWTCVTGGNGGRGCRGRAAATRSVPRLQLRTRLDHPVVQVAYPDAVAYAAWAGRRLPSEVQWEYAAVACLRRLTHGATTWGTGRPGDGQHLAGRISLLATMGALGWVGTSAVGVVSAQRIWPVLDMIGNVWEWDATRYTSRHHSGQHPPVRGAVHLHRPETRR